MFCCNAANSTVTGAALNASGAAGEQRVTITPTQFHFHARSEHNILGRQYPLELHIVSKVPVHTWELGATKTDAVRFCASSMLSLCVAAACLACHLSMYVQQSCYQYVP